MPGDFLRPITMRSDLHKKYEAYFSRYLTPDMMLYDVGCGAKPFAAMLKGKVKSHIGVDIADGFYDPSTIDLVGSAYSIPVEDGTADAVVLSEVLEHLERPRDAIKDAARALREDGLLFLSFPFFYPVHAEPYDFFRYTEYGIKGMLAERNFEILELGRIGGFWYSAGFFAGVYLQHFDRGIFAKTYLVKFIMAIVQYACLGLHNLEGLALKAAHKDVQQFRMNWTVNYSLVAKKKQPKHD